MNISSKQWALVAGRGFACITHKPSGQCRNIFRSNIEASDHELAMMHERTFDRAMRDAFNAAR